MRKALLLFIMLAAQAASAQVSLPLQVPAANQAANPAITPAVSAGTATSGLFNGYAPDDTYKLRAGDAISFQIMEDQVWNPQDTGQSLVVQDSGEINAPYIGRVMAVGKTCKQLAEDIKTSLEKDYYHQATVIISLNVASRILGRVYVAGQVHNPGPLDVQVNENLTAGQAILRAGGFADYADKGAVKVVRTSATGAEQIITLNMVDILDKGKADKDILLQPNDMIIVSSRLINF
jgi:protein involved in polysaccharide export with SLBB domain